MDEGHQWPPSSHHLDHLEKKTHKNVGSILSPCFVNAIIIILTDWSVKYLSSMRAWGSQAMREKFGAVAEVSARQIQTKVQLEPISCTVQCSGHSAQFSLQCREIIDACVTRGPDARLSTLSALQRELPSI